jgi:uncharacterized protein (DUF433 family)
VLYNEGVEIPEVLDDILVATPDTLSGAVRFRGTRVPVQALLDTLLSGESLDDFLDGFPGVTREQAEAIIRFQQNLARPLLGLDLAS